jgi:hypothetical protein
VTEITRPGRRIAFVLAVLLLVVAHRGRTAAAQSAPPPAQATCVFSNPAYAGKCTETTAVASGSTAQQACQSILQCLNDVGCLKTYCQATTLRSGWTLETAK